MKTVMLPEVGSPLIVALADSVGGGGLMVKTNWPWSSPPHTGVSGAQTGTAAWAGGPAASRARGANSPRAVRAIGLTSMTHSRGFASDSRVVRGSWRQ
ncbi:hypothetical protein GCM10022419_117140 [Nonomuraea rosea]|uniref:Uncharacterized protein n=1 Tax=Nonomuraea rosea TaxID=638574 RepID=A0ABP6ZKL0_9ACTN